MLFQFFYRLLISPHVPCSHACPNLNFKLSSIRSTFFFFFKLSQVRGVRYHPYTAVSFILGIIAVRVNLSVAFFLIVRVALNPIPAWALINQFSPWWCPSQLLLLLFSSGFVNRIVSYHSSIKILPGFLACILVALSASVDHLSPQNCHFLRYFCYNTNVYCLCDIDLFTQFLLPLISFCG